MTDYIDQSEIGFNGAVTFWLRKSLRIQRAHVLFNGFNGAVTFWLRKSPDGGVDGGDGDGLQWGRNILVTEICQGE